MFAIRERERRLQNCPAETPGQALSKSRFPVIPSSYPGDIPLYSGNISLYPGNISYLLQEARQVWMN